MVLYLSKKNNELYHHGILGQKWGVRRYQNYDGTLTAAGKKRYGVDIDNAEKDLEIAKTNYKNALSDYRKAKMSQKLKAYKKELEALSEVNLAIKNLEDEKIKDKINNEKGETSTYRQKLETYYKSKGLTDEEAAVAAYKREKTEKILAAVAGTALVAAAAYVAYKEYDKSVDKIIKSGTILQNISTNSNKGISDAFYFSMTKSDNIKYQGLYGNQLSTTGKDIFKTNISVTDSLKIASEKSATKALSDLVKSDANYASALTAQLENLNGKFVTPKQNKVINDGLSALKSGTVNSKVYEALNLSLTDHSSSTSDTVQKGFYNKLSSLGYNAISDINDKKYSGYQSKSPTIAFDSGSKLAVSAITKLDDEDIASAASKAMTNLAVNALLKQTTVYAVTTAAVSSGMKYMKNKNEMAIVQEYRNEHPNSTLSYNEIVANYYSES